MAPWRATAMKNRTSLVNDRGAWKSRRNAKFTALTVTIVMIAMSLSSMVGNAAFARRLCSAVTGSPLCSTLSGANRCAPATTEVCRSAGRAEIQVWRRSPFGMV
jgi:hypothetical protein